MHNRKLRSQSPRSGMAMILVLGVGLVVLALGMAMISTSSGILQSTVDSKQRIRSRYAAEAMIAIAIAQAVEKANQFFGASLQLDESPMASLGTGNGEKGQSKVKNRVDPSQKLSRSSSPAVACAA
jgi:type II secretory pathway component PulK